MRWLFLLSLILVVGCSRVEPVYRQDINKSYLQLLHNRERSKQNIDQLEYSEDLDQFAQEWAEYMAGRRRLTHSNLGFSGRTKGENIAEGQRDEDEVLDGWMGSRGHKENILNPDFTHVGFGCARTRDGTLYWCACFKGD